MARVHEAIVRVMREVGAIEKRAPQNAGIKYKFRGVEQFMNELHPLMSKEGLFVIPRCQSITREERTSNSGSKLIYSIINVDYNFFAEDGSECAASVVGEAMDSGDKSCNKAMSAALKYLLMQVFMVPTEELKDPDDEVYQLKNISFDAKSSMDAFKELQQYFNNAFLGDKRLEALQALADKRGVENPGDIGKLLKLYLEPLGAKFTAKDVTNITPEAVEDVKQAIREVAKG